MYLTTGLIFVHVRLNLLSFLTNKPIIPFSLNKLQHLSVLDNNLEEVPAELGHLTRLSEMNLTSNNLSSLPQQLYQCKELTKLYIARNRLTSLPEVGFHFRMSF